MAVVKGDNLGGYPALAGQFFQFTLAQSPKFPEGGADAALSPGVQPNGVEQAGGFGEGQPQGYALQRGSNGFPACRCQRRAAQQLGQHRQLNETDVDESPVAQFLPKGQAGEAGRGNHGNRGHQVALLYLVYQFP